MTPAETRERLRDLHQKAKAVGLDRVVTQVDIALALASALAIQKLEVALAEPTPARPPVAPPMRKPAVPLGSAPSIRMSAPRPARPKAPRKITGPDKFDLEILF